MVENHEILLKAPGKATKVDVDFGLFCHSAICKVKNESLV